MYPSERASHAFKCGYIAAREAHFAGQTLPETACPQPPDTFYGHDWLDGRRAFLAYIRASIALQERNQRQFAALQLRTA